MAETQEAVALALFNVVAFAEGKPISGSLARDQRPTKEWVLDTYRECLKAVKGDSLVTLNIDAPPAEAD